MHKACCTPKRCYCMTNSIEYTITIPVKTTVVVEVMGNDCSSYEELLLSVKDADLKEASLHIPQEQIMRAFIQAIAENNISIKKTP